MKTLLLLVICLPLLSQSDEGFIYAKISMRNGMEYQGTVQWVVNDEKDLYWFDSFEAIKQENEFVRYVSNDQLSKIEENEDPHILDGTFRTRNQRLNGHQFVCYYGDIKSIQVDLKDYAIVTLKNNKKIEVKGTGASNTNIIVNHKSNDFIKLKWRDIDRIDFTETPKQLKQKLESPLYGEVKTFDETFEGLVQWDYKQSLGSDELFGYEHNFLFKQIHSIKKLNDYSIQVILRNGKEYQLKSYYQLSQWDRHIIVKDRDFGHVKIPWQDFHFIQFKTDDDIYIPKYNDFFISRPLQATVILEDNRSIFGRLVYDLDESNNSEMLDGKSNGLYYSIPFRNISSIIPSDSGSARVKLRNKTYLNMYGTVDVSNKNDGLLVWADSAEPKYVPWSHVRSIELEELGYFMVKTPLSILFFLLILGLIITIILRRQNVSITGYYLSALRLFPIKLLKLYSGGLIFTVSYASLLLIIGFVFLSALYDWIFNSVDYELWNQYLFITFYISFIIVIVYTSLISTILINHYIQANKSKNKYLKKLPYKLINKKSFVALNDVEYLKSNDNYVSVYSKKKQHFLIRQTLSSLEEQLDPRHFQRIHRQYMVNINCITSFNAMTNGRYQVDLSSGQHVLVSRKYAHKLKQIYMNN